MNAILLTPLPAWGRFNSAQILRALRSQRAITPLPLVAVAIRLRPKLESVMKLI